MRRRFGPDVVFACALFGLLMVAMLAWLGSHHAMTHDFVSFYASGALAWEGDFAGLYDLDRVLQKEREAAPEVQRPIPFVRPVSYALMLAPLSALPYPAAFWTFLVMQTALLGACFAWAARRFGNAAIVAAFLYPPAVLGISHGQDSVLFLAVLTGAYILAGKKRPFLSGLVLGLGLIKFHLFLLWPLTLLAQRRWRMLGGFCATGAMHGALSLALVGWSGLANHLAVLRSGRLEAISHPLKQVSLWGVVANLGLPAWTGCVLAATFSILVLRAVHRGGLDDLVTLSATGCLLVSPHIYFYDPVMLLLPLWLVMFRPEAKVARRAALVMASPLVFSFVLFDPPAPVVPGAALAAFAGILLLTRSQTAEVQT